MAGRKDIYYWKCDRPSAFFAIEETRSDKGIDSADEKINPALAGLLTSYFGSPDFTLVPAGGQGNHQTYLARHAETTRFIRLENGPDSDDYMEAEAAVMDRVRTIGVPTPVVYQVDSSRKNYPFAYQIMECVRHSDLNQLKKNGDLQLNPVMHTLGRYVARWQQITLPGYGPFDIGELRSSRRLRGLHAAYRDYYWLNLERHLTFLTKHGFLSARQIGEIVAVINANDRLLDLEGGCLVHKDLALWNILGDSNRIRSVIDWDDSICGDPTDDLSLLACFHGGTAIETLLAGYQGIRTLPSDFEQRFWMHLLRNMIFKAVIRVGAGYFTRDEDFFLLSSVSDGASLHRFTLERIQAACAGLRGKMEIYELE